METYKRSIIVVVLLAITLPYLLAWRMGGQDWVFAGFLMNPTDGASYMAKMQQGFDGLWRFTLPFTAEPGEGAYLFLFYTALGHLTRLLSLPLVLVYHLARLAGAAALLLALFAFFARSFPGRPDLQRTANWLAVVGAGMGWLVVFFGPPPADFWVAEAYPFLSMYTNPHFPLGLALVLWVFCMVLEPERADRLPKLLATGLLISIIMPFGIVIALMVAAGWAAWTWLETRYLHWQPVVCLGALGGPFLLYQFWAAQVDPVLAGWNAQNVTVSPPVWDFLLSFSPAFVLAVFGAVVLFQREKSAAIRMLLVWFVLGALLIYFPFSLQRRFMFGFYVPSVALAVWGIDALRQRFPPLQRRLVPLTFGLALPSTILLLLTGVFGALGRAPLLYLAADEARALDWIRAETPAQALILAAPETGRWIPGWTGRRVIYGHPYETVNAEAEEARVLAAYQSSDGLDPQVLAEYGVDYVIYGPRERALNETLDLSALPRVYQTGGIAVYAVPRGP